MSSALAMDSSILEEGFPDYVLSTNETGPCFYVFVLIYTVLAFVLIAPLTIWGRNYEKERQRAIAAAGFYDHANEFAEEDGVLPPQQPILSQQFHLQNIYLNEFHQNGDPVEQTTDPNRLQQQQLTPRLPPTLLPKKQNSMNRIFRGIDDRVSTNYILCKDLLVRVLSGPRNLT